MGLGLLTMGTLKGHKEPRREREREERERASLPSKASALPPLSPPLSARHQQRSYGDSDVPAPVLGVRLWVVSGGFDFRLRDTH